MIKTNNENYFLSPILDHKEKYDLGGIEIKIAKDYENNLRSRNCQLGIVESLTDRNPLGLEVGDLVFVNHFTFMGDIGHDRSFMLKEHFEYDGKLLFPVNPQNILFKYNNEDIEPVGDTVIVEEVLSEEQTPSGIILDVKPYKDRGRVIFALDGSLLGETVIVDQHALYALELKGKNYYKVRYSEIAAILRNDSVAPSFNRIVVRDCDKQVKSELDLSFMKQPNTRESVIVSVGEINHPRHLWAATGRKILRFSNSGIPVGDYEIVSLDEDRILGEIL